MDRIYKQLAANGWENPKWERPIFWYRLVYACCTRETMMMCRVHGEDGEFCVANLAVGSGGGFGASPLRQGIGLGKATGIRTVEIFWPTTGKTQMVSELKPDRLYILREDQRTAVESKPMRFTLAVPTETSHEPSPAAPISPERRRNPPRPGRVWLSLRAGAFRAAD